MVYCETIESSKTWTCPKTGVWKVICIGGGGAGYCSGESVGGEGVAAGTPGETTSFGTYLSASGGKSGTERLYSISCLEATGNSFYYKNRSCYNGYNGIVEYGSFSESRATGLGYGASGSGNGNFSAVYKGTIRPGDVGEVKVVILDISANTQVPCTIGKGGEGVEELKKESTGEPNLVAFPGSSGAIILQYLGSSM